MSQANPIVKLVAPAQFAGGPSYWSVDGVMIQAQDAASAVQGLYGTAMTFYTGPISNSAVPAGPNAGAVLNSTQLGPPQPGSLMALSQTPVAAIIVNLSRPGAIFIVGDIQQTTITGPPNSPVTMLGLVNGVMVHPSTTVVGNTDGSGTLVKQGVWDASGIGDHVQTWYVGGVPATPLTYSVLQVAPASSVNAGAGGTAGGRSAGTQPQAVNQFSSVNAGAQGATSPTAPVGGTSTNALQQGVVAATAASSVMDYMPLILVGAGVLVLMSMGKR